MGQQLAALVRTQFSNSFHLLGYADDVRPKGEKLPDGLTVVGSLREAARTPCSVPEKAHILFAIGYNDMRARLTAYECAKDLGYRFASLVHPRAHVEPGVDIGEGSFIHAGAVVDIGCHFGAVTFLDIGVLVGERVKAGDGNYISAGAVIGGNLTMGDGNFVGMSAVLRDGLQIGNLNTVPAQALLLRDAADQMHVMEARTIRLVGPVGAS
jgi:UDP-perosamine 4-acetyltransferase